MYRSVCFFHKKAMCSFVYACLEMFWADRQNHNEPSFPILSPPYKLITVSTVSYEPRASIWCLNHQGLSPAILCYFSLKSAQYWVLVYKLLWPCTQMFRQFVCTKLGKVTSESYRRVVSSCHEERQALKCQTPVQLKKQTADCCFSQLLTTQKVHLHL